MTAFEWVMVSLTAAGFLATCCTGLVVVTRAVEEIKRDTSSKIEEVRREIAAEALAREKALSAAVDSRNEEIDKLRADWTETQRVQDHNVGELGLSLRRYIEAVEKEMRKIELWGRDNYVQRPELDSVRSDIKTLGSDMKAVLAEIKSDLKEDIRELKAARFSEKG